MRADDVHHDAVIVGAGVSGLACARALADAGAAVLVLEARERVGGRLLSVPAGGHAAGAVLDLGATWFWPHEQRVTAALSRHGLATFAQHTGGDAVVEVPAEEAAGDPPRPRRVRGNPIDVDSGRITAGAQSLAAALAAGLPAGALRLGTPVRDVHATDDTMRVRTLCGDEVTAAHVVLAVPPALAAATIELVPALPEKLAALARATPIWMAATVKVVARYRRAFWRDRGLAGAAVSYAGPLREIHDMSGPGGDPAALFGFAAPALPGTPDPALPGRALDQLVRLFGHEAAEPLQLHVQDWSCEPYTSPPGHTPTGAHHLFGHPAYQEPALGGRLHWAGTETATTHAGHIDGALQAGARAASAVLAHRDALTT